MASPATDIFTHPDGKPRRLVGATIYSSSTRLAELAIRVGFDTAWIEIEHGSTTYETAEAMCMAIEAAGGVPAIRLPDCQRRTVLHAVEIGAQILIVAMINTAEEAREVVRHAKFPPVGERGFNSGTRGVRFGLEMPAENLFAKANARTHVFTQVETREAVDNLDAICAVEGLSGIFIGPNDLAVSYGRAGRIQDPEHVALCGDILRRAKAAGKRAGILAAPSPLLDEACEAGSDLLFVGGDTMNLTKAWPALLQTIEDRRTVE